MSETNDVLARFLAAAERAEKRRVEANAEEHEAVKYSEQSRKAFTTCREAEAFLEAVPGLRSAWRPSPGFHWTGDEGQNGPAWYFVSRLLCDENAEGSRIQALAPMWAIELVDDLPAAQAHLHASLKVQKTYGRNHCHYWLWSIGKAVTRPCGSCGKPAYVVAHDSVNRTYDGDEAVTDVYVMCLDCTAMPRIGGWHAPPSQGSWPSQHAFMRQIADWVAEQERFQPRPKTAPE